MKKYGESGINVTHRFVRMVPHAFTIERCKDHVGVKKDSQGTDVNTIWVRKYGT